MDINYTIIGTAKDLGNGLFSTVDLDSGGSIIVIQKPLLLIAENQALHRVCANCFLEAGEGVELRPCSSCGVVNFCCDDCEKLSLKSEGSHGAECVLFKSRKPFEHSRAQISAQAVTNTACAYSNCQLKKATVNCIGCKAVNYCGKKCEDLDWPHHEKQCKAIQSQSLGNSLNKMLPTAVRGTIQLVSNLAALAKDSPLMDLASHEDDLRSVQSKWDDISLQAYAVVNLLQQKPEFVKYALESLCRLSTNGFRVESNIGNGPIGLCLDPLLARANHHCHPNSAITFDGKRATLRALSHIAKGEQIFISYIDETQRREVRREALAKTWFFQCLCSRCTVFQSIYGDLVDYPMVSTPVLDKLVAFQETYKFAKARVADENPETITRLFSLLHVLRHIEVTISNVHKTYQNIDRRLEFFKKVLGNLNDFILLQRYAQQPLPTVLNEIYVIYLEKANYISALIVLIFLIIHADPINYPSLYHPQRVTRMLALQRLCKFLASLNPEEFGKWETENLNEGRQGRLKNIDWISTCQLVMYGLRETGNRCWGKQSGVMRGVEMDITDVESIQEKRGDGEVGRTLRDWARGKDASGLGKVYAERLGMGLRELSGLVWDVLGVAKEGMEAN
ncbi:hypothetical protein BCON_0091g00290 [Botryotinia convoluta]|uniref:Uncharacterized protein n=1 Tax=Botryotinia convoluta TaxID=54673 RepID=A0A4Z1IFD9_9HELO|nr:hypothetical protein BCON_0091g00290 [Botryotinia convoluta]